MEAENSETPQATPVEATRKGVDRRTALRMATGLAGSGALLSVGGQAVAQPQPPDPNADDLLAAVDVADLLAMAIPLLTEARTTITSRADDTTPNKSRDTESRNDAEKAYRQSLDAFQEGVGKVRERLEYLFRVGAKSDIKILNEAQTATTFARNLAATYPLPPLEPFQRIEDAAARIFASIRFDPKRVDQKQGHLFYDQAKALIELLDNARTSYQKLDATINQSSDPTSEDAQLLIDAATATERAKKTLIESAPLEPQARPTPPPTPNASFIIDDIRKAQELVRRFQKLQGVAPRDTPAESRQPGRTPDATTLPQNPTTEPDIDAVLKRINTVTTAERKQLISNTFIAVLETAATLLTPKTTVVFGNTCAACAAFVVPSARIQQGGRIFLVPPPVQKWVINAIPAQSRTKQRNILSLAIFVPAWVSLCLRKKTYGLTLGLKDPFVQDVEIQLARHLSEIHAPLIAVKIARELIVEFLREGFC